MKGQARIVIIGAGIVGCSTAFHLANLGWKDIVVIEQGPIFETGGSTSHAPGLVFQTNPAKTMCKLAQDTVAIYSRLELDGQPCYYPIGGIEVAWTPERLMELKRRSSSGRAYGLDSEVISANESIEHIPLLSDKILGAMFVKNDGIAKAVRAAEAMANYCRRKGAAEFHSHTQVTGIEVTGGRVSGVETDKGRIKTDLILSAAGIWGPRIGRMVGITIPQNPMQHCYAETAPLPELEGRTEEVSHPILRHQDKSMYLRQEADHYGIGSYRHEPLLVEADDLLSHDEALDQPAIMPFTRSHFEEGRMAAGELIPALKNVGLAYKINGIFSFTNDGFPILGEWPQVKGFWSAEAVWITHAGGVGKAMAEWLVEGVPTLDLHECDVTRFHPHHLTKSYIAARAAQNYREVYDIIHPLQQMENPRNIKLSPFHQRQQELGGVFFEAAGWERPQWHQANEALLDEIAGDAAERRGWESKYWSPVAGAEHLGARSRVAMFDLTPFTKIEVTGGTALESLEHITSNRMDQPVGRITYTSMLNHKGGIKCDLTVTRLGKDKFMIITGCGSGIHDMTWIRANMPDDNSVQLSDVTSAMTCIGLWGPSSRELLSRVTPNDVSNEAFPYMSAQEIAVGGLTCLAFRISYVGELGWEIYAPVETGLHLWDTLWDAGQSLGVLAAGGAAFDSLRLEKGYRLWGNELHTEFNPYEAGIGFAVRLNKGVFLGREALIESRKNGLSRKLCCITFDERGAVAMGNEAILIGDEAVGHVTSAGYGYSVDSGIAYGYLPIEHAVEGTKVDILYFGARLSGKVAKDPLYDPENIRLRS